ncbi:hypothetical protein BDR22DRAFT_977402 [Usnea florida]
MVLKILAVTPGSESGCPPQQKPASEAIQHDDWDAPWILVGVPAGEVEVKTSHWHQEQSNGTVYIVGKHNDVYEVIIDPVYLLRLKYQYRHLNLNLNLVYNPINPGERQKDVYGIQKATKDARTLWLCHAAHSIRSKEHPEIQPAYEHFARLNGLHEALSRAIIASPPHIRKNLAFILRSLFLNLTKDYDSLHAYHYLASNEDDLLENFQLSLPIPVPPERTNCDEAQVTSLVRALLELSGGRVDVRQHECAQEYTLYRNADLYASVLGITRERTFGDSGSEQIYKELLESPVISETTITAQDLEEWTLMMRKFLPIGFPGNVV